MVWFPPLVLNFQTEHYNFPNILRTFILIFPNPTASISRILGIRERQSSRMHFYCNSPMHTYVRFSLDFNALCGNKQKLRIFLSQFNYYQWIFNRSLMFLYVLTKQFRQFFSTYSEWSADSLNIDPNNEWLRILGKNGSLKMGQVVQITVDRKNTIRFETRCILHVNSVNNITFFCGNELATVAIMKSISDAWQLSLFIHLSTHRKDFWNRNEYNLYSLPELISVCNFLINSI